MSATNLVTKDINAAAECLKQGGVIAYPTEAVFGLGCDPNNADAVARIIAIKNRSVSQGVIVVAKDWQQVSHYVDTTAVPPHSLRAALNQWPAHLTQLFPKSAKAPSWITGNHESIALRITAHQDIIALCMQADMPIVSTSANRHGKSTLLDIDALVAELSDEIDLILDRSLGKATGPSPIVDVLTDEYCRA